MRVPPPFKHQKRSIQLYGTKNILFDMSDPGTGKTRCILEGFGRRRAKGAKCMLVLAPKSILKSAWAKDCATFTPWLKTVCAYAENRVAAFAQDVDIYVTNHDAATWLAKQPANFFKRFDVLAIDEIGAYKHHTSQRSRAIAKIKKHFKVRWGTNATPTPNTITEIWNQANILDDGKSLGISFFAFRSTVCTPEQVGPRSEMVKWHDREGATDAVTMLLKDMTIRHVFEKCVDIPPNFSYQIPFELSAKHMAQYLEMQRDAMLLLQNGAKVSAINKAAVVTKLLQIASGAVYSNESEYQLLTTDRYSLVLDLVEQAPHSIEFFSWVHQRDELIAEAKRRGITYGLIDGSVSNKVREETMSMYQAGFYRTMFCHPKSAAHGLTLTRGTRTIWASPTYNPEWFIQGNRRIYRTGQTKKTETVLIVAQDTIEEHVVDVLTGKSQRMTNVLSYLEAA